jgi:cytochrome c
MNSFELNKVLGALLGTCLVLVAMHIASGAIFSPQVPAKPGYEIAVKEEQPPAGAAPAAPAEEPIANVLASASVQRGAEIAKQCEACHNVQEGQGAKVGPDLYGVVGRKIASVPNFNYTSALKAKSGTWDFDTLNTWLTKPAAFAPGTAMTFAGLSSEKQRADVIDFLDSLSTSPVPLPKPQNANATAPANQAPAPAPAKSDNAAPANQAEAPANPGNAAPANPAPAAAQSGNTPPANPAPAAAQSGNTAPANPAPAPGQSDTSAPAKQ